MDSASKITSSPLTLFRRRLARSSKRTLGKLAYWSRQRIGSYIKGRMSGSSKCFMQRSKSFTVNFPQGCKPTNTCRSSGCCAHWSRNFCANDGSTESTSSMNPPITPKSLLASGCFSICSTSRCQPIRRSCAPRASPRPKTAR